MTGGAALFARYAFPPNIHGFCGPTDTELVDGLLTAHGEAEIAHIVQQFEGAWPYLELIAGCNGLDPLDRRVVEAYWVGNDLLDHIDLLTWGNSLMDRFRHRSGASGLASMQRYLLVFPIMPSMSFVCTRGLAFCDPASPIMRLR
ncbi:MAG: DUF6390 family protein [Actinomycetia bacterium]|nr:DUF6390 family protein [Actinomycetes bacterium]